MREAKSRVLRVSSAWGSCGAGRGTGLGCPRNRLSRAPARTPAGRPPHPWPDACDEDGPAVASQRVFQVVREPRLAKRNVVALPVSQSQHRLTEGAHSTAGRGKCGKGGRRGTLAALRRTCSRKDSDLLMCLASRAMAPVDPVLCNRSLPAKSARCSFARTTRSRARLGDASPREVRPSSLQSPSSESSPSESAARKLRRAGRGAVSGEGPAGGGGRRCAPALNVESEDAVGARGGCVELVLGHRTVDVALEEEPECILLGAGDGAGEAADIGGAVPALPNGQRRGSRLPRVSAQGQQVVQRLVVDLQVRYAHCDGDVGLRLRDLVENVLDCAGGHATGPIPLIAPAHGVRLARPWRGRGVSQAHPPAGSEPDSPSPSAPGAPVWP